MQTKTIFLCLLVDIDSIIQKNKKGGVRKTLFYCHDGTTQLVQHLVVMQEVKGTDQLHTNLGEGLVLFGVGWGEVHGNN